MDLSTHITLLRGLGKAMLAGALILLVCASTIAAGNSALHEKFHADHGSPTHACLLSTLEHGLGDGPVEGPALLVRPEFVTFVPVPNAGAWGRVILEPFSGRGPPCLS